MNGYLVLILLIIIGDYLLDVVVETLNVRHLSTDLPQEFEGFYDAEKYSKAQHYLKENTRFGIIVNSITTPLTIIFIMKIIEVLGTLSNYAENCGDNLRHLIISRT